MPSPAEEFAASLDCLVEEAAENGASAFEILGAMTCKMHFISMVEAGLFDADSEGDEE